MGTGQTIKALFLDVGGVLLANSWERSMRQRAAETFHLDWADLDERPHLTFDTYESGKLSLGSERRMAGGYRGDPIHLHSRGLDCALLSLPAGASVIRRNLRAAQPYDIFRARDEKRMEDG